MKSVFSMAKCLIQSLHLRNLKPEIEIYDACLNVKKNKYRLCYFRDTFGHFCVLATATRPEATCVFQYAAFK